MYAGVSEAEKMVIEGGERDEVTREVSVSHTMKQQRDRQTDRQTRLYTFIENPDGCMFFGHSNSVV